jgi:predicted RNA-binding protein associated with RNAse of E/G family
VVLQLLRSDADYGVWKFFGTDGTFLRWYINFEAPIVRHAHAFETDDHGLDLVVYPDGTREWKDVDDLHRQRAQGRINLSTVGRVLAAAAEVTDLLDAGTEWWRPWAGWKPGLPSPSA